MCLSEYWSDVGEFSVVYYCLVLVECVEFLEVVVVGGSDDVEYGVGVLLADCSGCGEVFVDSFLFEDSGDEDELCGFWGGVWERGESGE